MNKLFACFIFLIKNFNAGQIDMKSTCIFFLFKYFISTSTHGLLVHIICLVLILA